MGFSPNADVATIGHVFPHPVPAIPNKIAGVYFRFQLTYQVPEEIVDANFCLVGVMQPNGHGVFHWIERIRKCEHLWQLRLHKQR